MAVASLLMFALATPLHAEDRTPERKEIWVPTKELDAVLKQHPNAVMLDRAQYEALIKDAGRVKPEEKDKPPAEPAIESIKFFAKVADGAASTDLSMDITFTTFRDGWAAVNVGPLDDAIADVKLDADTLVAFVPSGTKPTPTMSVQDAAAQKSSRKDLLLLSRKAGRHVAHLTVPSRLFWKKDEGSMQLPTYGLRGLVTLDLQLPEQSVMTLPLEHQKSGPGHYTGIIHYRQGIACWNRKSDEPTQAGWSIRHALVRAELTDQGLASTLQLDLHSERDSMPHKLVLLLPDENMNVVSATSRVISKWNQIGKRLEIDTGTTWDHDMLMHLRIEQPWTALDDNGKFGFPVPVFEGDTGPVPGRIAVYQTGTVSVTQLLGEGTKALVESGIMEPYPYIRGTRKPDEVNFAKLPAEFTYGGGVSFSHLPKDASVVVRRAGDHFSADVDNHVVLSTHEMTLERTIVVRGEEGRVTRVVLTLPANEQFLALGRTLGDDVQWKQIASDNPAKPGLSAFEITWPTGLKKGNTTTLLLQTRQDLPAGLTTGNLKSQTTNSKFLIENVRLADAVRVAGYVALDFDESWKVSTPYTTGLESRDARVTPVHGRMAWFNLRDYKLSLDIARNEPVLDATVLAYALPRAKQIELEGQFTLEVSRAPLRKFDVKLPVAIAKLLRVDSPLVGEQNLDEDTGVWHFTMRKEFTGTANVRFHLNLPAQTEKTQDTKSETENGRLVSTLPRFEVPTARRFAGRWVIEANTDTELSYETKGVQPLDALRVPVVEGYQPRHRVLASYGYTAADHQVKLTATRHEPSALVSAIVNKLDLVSVVALDGTSRHTATMNVKHNGQQFMAMRMPKGATLLSAKAGTETVKPVRAGDDEVRVPLNGRTVEGEAITVSVVYEMGGAPWRGRGQQRLEPLTVGENVPVLSSSWKVLVPEGYEVGDNGKETKRSKTAPTPELLGLLSKRYFKTGYVATGRIVAGVKVNVSGGRDSIQNTQGQSFYGTQIEILESGALRARALERLRSLHPELQEHDVEIRVTQTKGSAILNVSGVCESPKYGRLFVDALLDEYIGFRKELLDRESQLGGTGERLDASSKFNSEMVAIMERPNAATEEEVEMEDFTPKYPKPMFVGTPAPLLDRATPAPATPPAYSRSYYEEKMSKIILPELKFEGVSLRSAIDYLRVVSKNLDNFEPNPVRKGVDLVLKQGAAPSTAQITLDLKEVPMLEALRYVTELAGMKYKIEPYAVVIVPITETATEQHTRKFKVPPDVLTGANQSSPKDWLEAKGISFPAGSSAVFNVPTSLLVVRNTQPNLDAIRKLLASHAVKAAPVNDDAIYGGAADAFL